MKKNAKAIQVESAIHRVIARCVIHEDHVGVIVQRKNTRLALTAVARVKITVLGVEYDFSNGSRLFQMDFRNLDTVNGPGFAGMRFNTALLIGVPNGKQLEISGRCTRSSDAECVAI